MRPVNREVKVENLRVSFTFRCPICGERQDHNYPGYVLVKLQEGVTCIACREKIIVIDEAIDLQ